MFVCIRVTIQVKHLMSLYISLLRLFAFPKHQVHEAADESHGEADPRQDIRGAVGTVPETGDVKALFLSRVDGRSDHHTQRGQKLNDGCEDESLSLLDPEKLKDEDEEADAA